MTTPFSTKGPDEVNYKNIGIISIVEKKLDYSFIDDRDIIEIKTRLAYIKELFQIYTCQETLLD